MRARRLTHAQLALRAVRCAQTETRYATALETTRKHERDYLAAIYRALVEVENDLRRVVAGAR